LSSKKNKPYFSAHYFKNHERNKEVRRNYAKNNPQVFKAIAARRYQRLKLATPKWLTLEQKMEMYEMKLLARECRWMSEEPLQVDHIVPLVGNDVCGLNVPWNLQIIPVSWNKKKGASL
jgi:hypothetical protein